MRRLRRILLVLVALVLLAGATCVGVQDVTPFSADAIRRKTDEINQAAAITVPHGFDDGAVRHQHVPLFEAVEQGRELSSAESTEYRRAYQDIIFRKQSTLRRFDRQLTVLPNVDMDRPNNVGGLGIEGSHDHHDASMRANLLALEAELQTIEAPASSSRARVWAAISAYKNATDILSHLATVPHTKSVAYRPPPAAPTEIEQQGELLLQDFKQAQFAPVNGTEYWAALWRGLDRFDLLLLRVQTTVNSGLSATERRLAGRWDSTQSLGRWLTNGTTPRRYRPGPPR